MSNSGNKKKSNINGVNNERGVKMSKKVRLKAVATYNGHNIKSNKSVDLNLLFGYDELPNYIRLIQMLNENIRIAVKVPGENKPIKLGTFMINRIAIDNDGEGKVKFNSMIDYVETILIDRIINKEPFQVMFAADIDEEGSEEEDD